MTMEWFVVFLCVRFAVTAEYHSHLFEGDYCSLRVYGQTGQCVAIRRCPYAINLIRKSGGSRRPQTCGFDKSTPIVCCPEWSIVPSENKNVETSVVQKPKKSGNRSMKKCFENYPEARNDYLAYYKGVKSLRHEFPHLVRLGYGTQEDGVEWKCGGSLISENFVLTAAHCLYSQKYGKAKWARLAFQDTTTDNPDPQNIEIVQTFPHPNHNPASHYHDIALVRLARPAPYTHYVNPACLYAEDAVPGRKFSAAGWGKPPKQNGSRLLKVDLDHVGHEECRKLYSTSPKLVRGILDDIQICAGGGSGEGACPGDSGGPLLTRWSGHSRVLVIVGVSSFGNGCGAGSDPGVYTKVAHYMPWIEDIVWPN